MTSYQKELKRLMELEQDLKSEIVEQEEKGHYDGYGGFVQEEVRPGVIKHYFEPMEYIVDQPKIAKPDIEKRKKAWHELEQMKKTSKYYRIRYRAQKALGY